jgi:outer membrane protein assembly factor BamB
VIRVALLFLICSSALCAGDSLMYKGSPQRLGSSDLNLGLPITLAWEKEAGGAFYSSPAIFQDTIYLGNSDHNVYAFDLQTGIPKWKSTLPERVYGSSPQIDGTTLYIACVNGCIFALSLADGKETNRYCLTKGQFLGTHPDILGSPLVADGKLYFGSDDQSIYCFDLAGGARRWSFATQGSVHDAAASLLDHLVYMGSTDGHFYALDKDTGSLAWKSPDFQKLNTTAMLANGRLYFGAGDKQLHCIDALTGKEAWNFQTERGIMSSPALSADGTRLVFGGADDYVYCLDMKGVLVWKFKTGASVLASPLLTGDTVWIGSYDANFYALNLLDGSKRFSYKTQSSIFSTAAASDNKVVVGDRSGNLYCFNAASK